MAMVKAAVALLVMVALFAVQEVSNAAVHKVGDSAGWTTIGNIDYKQWSATKTFQVGDIILFEYNSQFHNVMRVTHTTYRACNTSAPLATYTTGNDSITITTKGHHYFFCGVPGHCQSGQKLDINVLRTTADDVAPTPSGGGGGSADSLSPPPPVPATKAPGPSSSDAVSFRALKCLPGNNKLGLALLVFAVFVTKTA